jgi:hypothetical protein
VIIATRIVIRHVAGSKIHRVEQFPLDAHKQLSFGRSRSATIQFDPLADAEVSRNHGAIRVVGGETPSFVLVDLDSSNGTFLNGRRITGEAELLPADEIALGEGGPKFVFDVRPPLDHLAPRTRLSAVATRRNDSGTAPPKPVSVGGVSAAKRWPSDRDGGHLNSAVAEPPSAGGRSLRYAAIAVLLLVGLVVVYYGFRPSVWAPRSAVAPAVVPTSIAPSMAPPAPAVANAPPPKPSPESADAAPLPPPALPVVAPQVPQPVSIDEQKALSAPSATAPPAPPLPPTEAQQGVLQKYASAIARIETRWSLRDRNGKALYLRIATCNGQIMPVYVRLPDGQSVPWLTTSGDPGDRPIGETMSSTGFIISGEGLILTSWQAAYPHLPEQIFDTHSTDAATVLLMREPPSKNQPPAAVSICDITGPEPRVPNSQSEGLVFDGRVPLQVGGWHVLAPYYETRVHQSGGIPRTLGATLDSQTGEGAVMLRLVNPVAGLLKVQVAPRGTVKPGDSIVVLGYSRDDPSWPRVTPGAIVGIDSQQDYIVDVPGVDQTAEGAPIFDASGSLIAILTLSQSPDGKITARGLPVDAVRARLESNATPSSRVTPGMTVPPPPTGR